MGTLKEICLSRPLLGQKEQALLMCLLTGRTKLRRFPSLQWSIGGNHFIRSTGPGRLYTLGLIEKGSISKKGVTLYVATEIAKKLFSSDAKEFSQSVATDHNSLDPATEPFNALIHEEELELSDVDVG
jgi:hypothetical protein